MEDKIILPVFGPIPDTEIKCKINGVRLHQRSRITYVHLLLHATRYTIYTFLHRPKRCMYLMKCLYDSLYLRLQPQHRLGFKCQSTINIGVHVILLFSCFPKYTFSFRCCNFFFCLHIYNSYGNHINDFTYRTT